MRRQYGGAVWKTLKEYAVWEPGRALRLGDYGIIRENCFEYLGNISEFSATAMVADRPPSQAPSISAMSKGATYAKGNAETGDGIASLKISFAEEAGAWLTAGQSSKDSCFETKWLAQELGMSRNWKRHWKVVTGVRVAETFNLIASRERGAQIELQGNSAAIDQFIAGTVEAGLQIKGSVALQYLGKSGPISVTARRLRVFGSGFSALEPDEASGSEGKEDFELEELTDSPDSFEDTP